MTEQRMWDLVIGAAIGAALSLILVIWLDSLAPIERCIS